ncbi:Uncharacterised protein [Delftia tsuruhatensis]|uniref:DUF5983 family protein n=1 Tax=Delftia tsuruhatensis TaxID=180282 RepID=UPI001E76C335|nr:ABC transporter substrate-binding protein [Delftia tsuruhatensis]CAB5670246.1 Uncharacterised protein [Delftia tsuruhatensis]CAC9682974.1 Uncharacterised protein [Delftia tsuruhatensis]
MSQTDNPFVRGYWQLHISRTLFITPNDPSPPIWRPLHPAQSHLPDHAIVQLPCLVAADFALITEGQNPPSWLAAQCAFEGTVQSVVYSIEGRDLDGKPTHVGDVYSPEDAAEVVRRLTLATGFHSRYWEISRSHLSEEAYAFLCKAVQARRPQAGYEVFQLANSMALAVLLSDTPWTDATRHAKGMTREALRQRQYSSGMPSELVTVLHLAAQAEVRILVFDADAPQLLGLSIYPQN